MASRCIFLSLLWLMISYVCFYAISAETTLHDSLDPVSYKENSFDVHPDLSDDNTFPAIGCVPCSQKYLLSSLSERSQTLSYEEIKTFLSREFWPHSSCKMVLPNSKNKMPQLSTMRRHLDGNGFHRRLISSVSFVIPSAGMLELEAYDCSIVLIESLPVGVFADSFELLRLAHKKVYQDAAIFGDTNLELPSALSNRSTVELHLNGGHSSLLEAQRYQLSVEMPLHARYPPLDVSGYSKVEIEPPIVVMLLKPKNIQQECSSLVFTWSVRSKENIVWNVPCGNQDFSALVSSVTFMSAIISAFIILYASIAHSFSGNHVKKS